MSDTVWIILIGVSILIVSLLFNYLIDSNLPGTASGALKPFIDNALSRLFQSRRGGRPER